MPLKVTPPLLAWRWAAKGCLAVGWSQGALWCAWRTLNRQRGNVFALATLAHLRAGQNRQRKALLWQRRVVQTQADVAAHWYNQGFLQERLGDPVQAEHSFREALNRSEWLDLAWFGLGLALQQQGKLEDALTAFLTNAQQQPFSPAAWSEMARVYRSLGRAERAQEVLRHLNSFEPKVALAMAEEWGWNPNTFAPDGASVGPAAQRPAH